MNTTNMGAYRAGRLLLAVADDDLTQTVTIMREAAGAPGGVVGLVVQVASAAIESCRAVVGDEWQQVMSTALHALEIDDTDV